MKTIVRKFKEADVAAMISIWNTIVDDGVSFPQTERLGMDDGLEFFREQSHTAVAVDEATGAVVGLYILHPNNIGRCGHIANASYAVDKSLRGQHIGRRLVSDCVDMARELGFRVLQFNAVVETNHGALHLYEELGFKRLGVIPGGFLMKDGTYSGIIPHYITL